MNSCEISGILALRQANQISQRSDVDSVREVALSLQKLHAGRIKAGNKFAILTNSSARRVYKFDMIVVLGL